MQSLTNQQLPYRENKRRSNSPISRPRFTWPNRQACTCRKTPTLTKWVTRRQWESKILCNRRQWVLQLTPKHVVCFSYKKEPSKLYLNVLLMIPVQDQQSMNSQTLFIFYTLNICRTTIKWQWNYVQKMKWKIQLKCVQITFITWKALKHHAWNYTVCQSIVVSTWVT